MKTAFCGLAVLSPQVDINCAMAITLLPIGEPFTRSCPHCHQPHATWTADGCEGFVEFADGDGDTIQLDQQLLNGASEGMTCYADLSNLVPSCCGVSMVQIEIKTFNGFVPWISAFAGNHFYADTIPPHARYRARRGDMEWIVWATQTERGNILCHYLPAHAWPDQSWISSVGVARCYGHPASPWEWATNQVQQLWDDLRELQAREQGTPWQMVPDEQIEVPRTSPRAYDAFDDEIPF